MVDKRIYKGMKISDDAYQYKKKSLKSRFIYPLAELLQQSRYEKDFLKARDLVYEAKVLGLEYQKIIEEKYPNFINKFINSNAYQELLDLLDYYRQPELKAYIKTLKKNVSFCDIPPTTFEQKDVNPYLKHFYKLFDDKKNRIDKTIYLKIKDLIIGDKYQELLTYRYEVDLPAFLLDWIELKFA
jgi:hypothetical protein